MKTILLPGRKHISRNALSTDIADQLCLWIRKEQMPPGTVLGTEAQLAQQYGVSRTVIREAVGQLRGLGIVISRQGVGLCVANCDTIDTIAKVLTPMMTDKLSWSNLCHMRFVIEVGSIPLAVERISSQQIVRLQKLAQTMLSIMQKKRTLSRQEEEKIAKLEIEFHQIILDATGCKFMEQFHSILVEYFNESTVGGPHRILPTMKDMEDHIKLVEAIQARDAGKAVAIMVDHIRNILIEGL